MVNGWLNDPARVFYLRNYEIFPRVNYNITYFYRKCHPKFNTTQLLVGNSVRSESGAGSALITNTKFHLFIYCVLFQYPFKRTFLWTNSVIFFQINL